MDKKFWILYTTLFLITCLGLILIYNRPLFIDEVYHYGQITYFLEGNFKLYPALTVMPGYHMIIYPLANLLGVSSLGGIRFISGIYLVMLLIPTFYFMTKDWKKTLLLYIFPITFSFFFLVYTDLMSLLFVLLGIYLYEKNKPTMSGLMFIISIAIRQNNIIFMGMIMVLVLIRMVTTPFEMKGAQFWVVVEEYIKKYWAYIFNSIILLGFIILNGGTVVDDRASHPFAIYFTNIWFMLFIMFFLFLPEIYSKSKELEQKLKGKGWIIILPTMLLGYLTYSNTHWYNNINNIGMIKNDVLQLAAQNFAFLTLFLLICGIVILWLSIVEFADIRKKWALGITTVIFLGMQQMVDMRYYIIPLSLFIIWRKDQPGEKWMLIYSGLLTLLFFYGVVTGRMSFW